MGSSFINFHKLKYAITFQLINCAYSFEGEGEAACSLGPGDSKGKDKGTFTCDWYRLCSYFSSPVDC